MLKCAVAIVDEHVRKAVGRMKQDIDVPIIIEVCRDHTAVDAWAVLWLQAWVIDEVNPTVGALLCEPVKPLRGGRAADRLSDVPDVGVIHRLSW